MLDHLAGKAVEKYLDIYAYKQLDPDREWTAAEKQRLEFGVRLTRNIKNEEEKWEKIEEVLETRTKEEIKEYARNQQQVKKEDQKMEEKTKKEEKKELDIHQMTPEIMEALSLVKNSENCYTMSV